MPQEGAILHRLEADLLTFTRGATGILLGGMIGLGGAELRLPLLIGVFGFAALPAVIMNKAMSLEDAYLAFTFVCSAANRGATILLSHKTCPNATI